MELIMNSIEMKANRRILIIDDNPSIHSDFRDILCPVVKTNDAAKKLEEALFDEVSTEVEQIYFELDSAFQGQEGLEMVKKSLEEQCPYAMAFVDVRMPPGWDGVETIAQIWKIYPELQVVVCTAYSDYSWDEMRAKVGQPDSLLILKKPFDNVEVQQMAHALTKKWMLNKQSSIQMNQLEQANKALTISEERFYRAFDENPLPCGIQKFNDQRFVDVNQRFTQVAGFSRNEMIGKTPVELSLLEKPDMADKWFASLSGNELVSEAEANFRTRDGKLREMRVSLSPFVLEGQPHVLFQAEDVSHRAMLERQLRQSAKMDAIGQLAAGVAHDFNNILTVIQGHAGLLNSAIAPGNPQSKSLQQISLAASRAATLIRQLLLFSRKQVVELRPLDVNQTVGNTINMLERLVGEHVEIKFTQQTPLASIYADTGMIEQIAINLAVNARDAMPDGGLLTISTSSKNISRPATQMDTEARNGEYVCLNFTDSGVGMEPSVLSRIFEPFFTTKPAGKGTGLGLSTVFRIVKQHKGWLEVESKLGVGTSFQLYFAATPQAVDKTSAILDLSSTKGNETVLVAEDEDSVRETLVEALRFQGYKVFTASSGQAALEVWEQKHECIDLLITDMVMPGGIMGGELARRLQNLKPKLKVIYTSGYSQGIAARDMIKLEGSNFLPKPYSIGKLTQCIRQCLDTPLALN